MNKVHFNLSMTKCAILQKNYNSILDLPFFKKIFLTKKRKFPEHAHKYKVSVVSRLWSELDLTRGILFRLMFN